MRFKDSQIKIFQKFVLFSWNPFTWLYFPGRCLFLKFINIFSSLGSLPFSNAAQDSTQSIPRQDCLILNVVGKISAHVWSPPRDSQSKANIRGIQTPARIPISCSSGGHRKRMWLTALQFSRRPTEIFRNGFLPFRQPWGIRNHHAGSPSICSRFSEWDGWAPVIFWIDIGAVYISGSDKIWYHGFRDSSWLYPLLSHFQWVTRISAIILLWFLRNRGLVHWCAQYCTPIRCQLAQCASRAYSTTRTWLQDCGVHSP